MAPFVSTHSHSGERVPLIYDANNNNNKSDEDETKSDDAKMKTTTFTAFAFVAFLSACAFAVSSVRGGKGASGVSLLGSSQSQSAKETITLVTGCSPRDLIYSLDFEPTVWTGNLISPRLPPSALT